MQLNVEVYEVAAADKFVEQRESLMQWRRSAVKEPGHFKVRKSSSQVTRMHFFLKKVDDLF